MADQSGKALARGILRITAAEPAAETRTLAATWSGGTGATVLYPAASAKRRRRSACGVSAGAVT
jgi:hypothetical protein